MSDSPFRSATALISTGSILCFACSTSRLVYGWLLWQRVVAGQCFMVCHDQQLTAWSWHNLRYASNAMMIMLSYYHFWSMVCLIRMPMLIMLMVFDHAAYTKPWQSPHLRHSWAHEQPLRRLMVSFQPKLPSYQADRLLRRMRALSGLSSWCLGSS